MNGPGGNHDTPDDRLRDAFASILEIAGNGEDCPRPEVLWESAGGQLGRRSQRAVILHLGECSACAAAWRLALDLREDEMPAKTMAAPELGFRRGWIPIAAAAAVLIVAVGLAAQFGVSRRENASVYRAQEGDWIHPLTGAEEALPRGRCILQWTPGPAGTVYDVRVTTEDLEPIARGRGVDRAEYLVPAASLDKVPTGGKILWQVTAHLPDDSRVDSKSFTSEVR